MKKETIYRLAEMLANELISRREGSSLPVLELYREIIEEFLLVEIPAALKEEENDE